MKNSKNILNVDFVAHKKLFFIISAALMIITIVATAILGVNSDIKYKGGSIVAVPYTGDVNLNKAENVIEDAIGEDVSLQIGQKESSTELVVTIANGETISTEETSIVLDSLKTAFPENITVSDVSSLQVNNVNSQIKNGFFKKALLALAVIAVVILLYLAIRFRKIGGFSVGLTTLLLLLHDAIITLATLTFFRFTFNDAFVAAFLAVLVYSVGAKIFVYDRICENKAEYSNEKSAKDIANKSAAQVISRTADCSLIILAVLIVTFVLALIFGLHSIAAFIITLCVGIIVSTYSSLCLSSSILASANQGGKEKAKSKKEKKVKSIEFAEEPKEIEVRTNFKINPKALDKFNIKKETDSKEEVKSEN